MYIYVVYFLANKEVKPSLIKPPLKLSDGLANLGLTTFGPFY